jgi:hypothetical protein
MPLGPGFHLDVDEARAAQQLRPVDVEPARQPRIVRGFR